MSLQTEERAMSYQEKTDRKPVEGAKQRKANKLILDESDKVELFHAFNKRGTSETRHKVAKFLRELDDKDGKDTPDCYWYSSPND